MAQSFIVEITQSGTIVLPEEMRKYILKGSKFTVSLRGDTISLKKVEEPVIQREPEVVARFRALREYFSKWAKEQGITEHDIKETIKKVRAEKHAKSSSQ